MMTPASSPNQGHIIIMKMQAGYSFYSKSVSNQAHRVQNIQSKLQDLESEYFKSASPYGNFILGYDFTLRGKKQRDHLSSEIFSRKEVPSIFQMIPLDESSREANINCLQ